MSLIKNIKLNLPLIHVSLIRTINSLFSTPASNEEIKQEEREQRGKAGRDKRVAKRVIKIERGVDKWNERGAKCFACLDRPQTPFVNLVHQSCAI